MHMYMYAFVYLVSRATQTMFVACVASANRVVCYVLVYVCMHVRMCACMCVWVVPVCQVIDARSKHGDNAGVKRLDLRLCLPLRHVPMHM